ncbi:MAG: PLP-dependent aminotransferase family protein [bacterium]|nr:PLP-dependent aminotransferase family protein [bacterium]
MILGRLKIDWDSSVPAYRQISGYVRAAVEDGRLEPGHRLPATRDLARQLGVNRNTVVAAYDALVAEGCVRSHTGRGTFVVPRPTATESSTPSAEPASTWFTAFSRTVEGATDGGLQSIYRLAISGEGISFVGSYPANETIPVERFGRAMARAIEEGGSQILAYGATAGFSPLRESIAADLRAKGATVDTGQILVTSGAQQALELVFRTFLDRGDSVIIEEPTYTGALTVFGAIGARAVGVPGDDQGLRPDLLEIALQRNRPKLIYVQPTFQNPTTCVMGRERREQLLEVARRHRCPVVEDDWAGDLRLGGEDLPSLYALDGGRHVIHVGTFSKKLMPGLRIGWVAAPQPVYSRLVELKRIEDCGTSPLLQKALHVFLQENGLSDHLRRVLPIYRERRDTMLDALQRHLPEGAQWTRPVGGLFLWVTLPGDFDGNELFVAARQKGVLFSRGELFHSNGQGRNSMRLTYSAASPSQIESGVAILGELIRERWPRGGDATRRSAVEAMPIF